MRLVEFDKFARSELHKYLLGMGIYPNTVCYQSLIECVIEAAAKESLSGQLSDIYYRVGRRFNKTSTAIERGLRCGLRKCMDENRMDTINDYFGYHVYRPDLALRNGEVISLFAAKVCEDYENNKGAAAPLRC